MPCFSQRSRERLGTCHLTLQQFFYDIVKNYDCIILEGHRDQEAQDTAYEKGHSQLKWPQGKHNQMPSIAVDVAPYPLNWEDHKRFFHFAGYVLAKAEEAQIRLRWGGDWDSDLKFDDQRLIDLPHYELIL